MKYYFPPLTLDVQRSNNSERLYMLGVLAVLAAHSETCSPLESISDIYSLMSRSIDSGCFYIMCGKGSEPIGAILWERSASTSDEFIDLRCEPLISSLCLDVREKIKIFLCSNQIRVLSCLCPSAEYDMLFVGWIKNYGN
jgi:hypothetical protein